VWTDQLIPLLLLLFWGFWNLSEGPCRKWKAGLTSPSFSLDLYIALLLAKSHKVGVFSRLSEELKAALL
jgi:hypothetical protein